MFEDEIEKAVHEIKVNHDKIIDDWCKAYMAQRHKDGKSIDIGAFSLCQQNLSWAQNEVGFKYWFEDRIPNFPNLNWIECKDQMPPKHQPFLVITTGRIGMMEWKQRIIDGEHKGWYGLYSACACCNGFCSDNFEYWMPLPEIANLRKTT